MNASQFESYHKEQPAFLVIGLGLMIVTIINLCAIVGIVVMKFFSKQVFNQIITVFVGLGVGSLSGSAFYHLLPQAHPSLMNEIDNNGEPVYSYLQMAHISLLGVYLFFFCDQLIKVVFEIRKQRKNQHRHSIQNKATERSDTTLVSRCGNEEEEKINETSFQVKTVVNQELGICGHEHPIEMQSGKSAIEAVAWMVIFGDGLHNLIDGVSIGAAFHDSLSSGLSLSLAVFFEEFPHELGDVAILVASGMTLKQALVYNLLSAATCYIGFFIGFGMGEMNPDVSKYVFGLAGGMFLYIALACMMPEMKKTMEEALNVRLRQGIYVLLLQSVGLFTGIFSMYVMARYGESISF